MKPDMTEDQFTGLYNYMEKRFDAVDARFDSKAEKSDIDQKHTILDSIAEVVERDDTERGATGGLITARAHIRTRHGFHDAHCRRCVLRLFTIFRLCFIITTE